MFKWILILLLSQNIRALEYEIIHEHSKISFEVDYMAITKVSGEFRKYNSTINIQNSQIESLEVQIAADSVFTNDDKRDFHLKSHEFFFASKYPIIKFTAKNINIPKKLASINFTGNLELHGIVKSIPFHGIYRGTMKDPWGKENLFFEFEASLNRKDFGMNWNKELDQGGFLVGDKVNIKVLVQAQKKGDKTAFSTHMIPATKGIIERDQLRKGKINKLTTSTK